MAEKYMSKKNLMDQLDEVTGEDIQNNRDAIIASRAPLWRKKRDGTLVIVPLDRLSHYLGEKAQSDIKLYMEKEWIKRIRSAPEITETEKTPEPPRPETIHKDTSPQNDKEPDHVFGKQLKHYRDMDIDQRRSVLDENMTKLRRQALLEKKLDIDAFTDIVDVVARTFYVNKATLEENQGSSQDLENIDSIIDKTNSVIESLIGLTEKENTNYRDFSSIDKISTGSTTVDHMNKVLLRFIPFCNFFNEYFSRGLIKKIRVNFRVKYYPYYRKLLPDKKNLTLETVFKGGIRRIESEELQMYSMGALLHDIGKLPDISYHDGSEGFDPRKVVQHAPLSYNMIIKAKLPWSIAAIAALHHEYYGDSSGYQVSKALFKHFKSTQKALETIEYIISYNPDDIKKGLVWAYFPSKMLEIIDVFDALTDKNRKYREAHKSIEDALIVLKQEFIQRRLKIDPILFDIFLEFVREYAVLNDPSVIDKLLK